MRHNGPESIRLRDITVTGVRGPAGGVIDLRYIDGLTVHSNSVAATLTSCTNVRTQ
jgi:hypothetical protein